MVPRSVDGQLLVDGILIDVSVQRRLELQLRDALATLSAGGGGEARSLVDPLTLIPNRRHFEDGSRRSSRRAAPAPTSACC